MSGVRDMITGKAQRQQQSLAVAAQAAQEEQRKQVDEEKRRLEKIATGQRLNAVTGGGGLLAYVDSRLQDTLG